MDDEPTPAEAEALAELERQERAERLARLRADEEAERQRVAREQGEQLKAIERRFKAATAKDGDLMKKRTRVAVAIVEYLELAEERKQQLGEVYETLQRLPYELTGEMRSEIGRQVSTATSEAIALWRVARHMRRPLGTFDHELMKSPPPVSLAEPEALHERYKRQRIIEGRNALVRSIS